MKEFEQYIKESRERMVVIEKDHLEDVKLLDKIMKSNASEEVKAKAKEMFDTLNATYENYKWINEQLQTAWQKHVN